MTDTPKQDDRGNPNSAAEEELTKLLRILHIYKYGKTAMQAGMTMRRNEGVAEAKELQQLLAAAREEAGREARIDELGELMSSKVLTHAWVPELDGYYNDRIAELTKQQKDTK